MGKNPTLQINSRALVRSKKGHPWVFRSDLMKIDAKDPGVVTVLSPKGKPLGTGLFSPKSQISLRWLHRGNGAFKTEMIRERIAQAYQLRQECLKDAQVGRMVFGEADGLPSLLIDRIEDLICFQTLSAGMETFKAAIVDYIKEIFSPQSIIEKNDATVRTKEVLSQI